MKSLEYSSVPNRRACTFIDFEKKFPPARPYFGLHVYCLGEKILLHDYFPAFVLVFALHINQF